MSEIQIIHNEIDNIEKKESQEDLRDKILLFQEGLSRFPNAQLNDQDDCPLKHSFGNGIYMREIFIPKGKIIVGKIHRHSHPNVLLKGEVSVVTEFDGVKRLKAPLSMISEAGTKRVVYAHEDTVWLTFHNVGEERDLNKIEEIVITKTYDELPDFCKKFIEVKVEESK